MTGEEHNKTLATLWFIYGAMHGLTLLGLLLLVLIVKLSVSDAITLSAVWIAISVIAFVVLLMFVGVLPLLVGFGFRQRSRWSIFRLGRRSAFTQSSSFAAMRAPAFTAAKDHQRLRLS